jgi:hypothetical protein
VNRLPEAINPQSEIPANPTVPQSESPKPGRGRPRVLDDVKRREVCALIAGGCSIQEAARYVRCSYKTIRREMKRDPAFHEHLRRSEMFAQLSPLRAMQQAAATHWRAAAWILERAYPDRFARRNATFGPKQARSLLSDILQIIRSEVLDQFQQDRIEKRLRVTFEYAIRAACDIERTGSDLRRAIKFFDEKDRLNDPLAPFGLSTPNLDELFRPKPPAPPQPASSEPPLPAWCVYDSVSKHAPSAHTNT